MEFKELLVKAQNKDEEAIKQLMLQTQRLTGFIAGKYTNNSDDAQEIIQRAYIKAFDNLSSISANPEKFPSWLGRIVTNESLNFIKEAHNRYNVNFSALDDTENSIDYDPADEQASTQPELAMDQKEREHLLDEIINTLSDEQRIVTMMYFFEDMKITEIAAELNCSENTVKSRLSYAKKKIKEAVLDLEKKEDIKLYSLSPLAFFLYLLRHQKGFLYNTAVTPVETGNSSTSSTAKNETGSTPAESGSAKAAQPAPGTGIKAPIIKTGLSVGAKIGIAAAVAATGVGIGIAVNSSNSTSTAEATAAISSAAPSAELSAAASATPEVTAETRTLYEGLTYDQSVSYGLDIDPTQDAGDKLYQKTVYRVDGYNDPYSYSFNMYYINDMISEAKQVAGTGFFDNHLKEGTYVHCPLYIIYKYQGTKLLYEQTILWGSDYCHSTSYVYDGDTLTGITYYQEDTGEGGSDVQIENNVPVSRDYNVAAGDIGEPVPDVHQTAENYYYDNGLLKETVYSNGFTKNYEYYSNGNLYRTINRPGNDTLYVETYEYVETADEANQIFSSHYAHGKVKILVDKLNVRDEPSTNGNISDTMNASDFMYQIDHIVDDGTYTWYMIGSNSWIADKDGQWVQYYDADPDTFQ